MNKDMLKGNWKEIKGETKATWGKLTDDDLAMVEGNRQKLLDLKGGINARISGCQPCKTCGMPINKGACDVRLSKHFLPHP